MELFSGPKMANGICRKTIHTGTIDRGSTVFTIASRLVLRPTQSSVQLVPEALYLRVKWLVLKVGDPHLVLRLKNMEPHVNPSILFYGVMMVNEEQGQVYPYLSSSCMVRC
jgi:hypothetical protein